MAKDLVLFASLILHKLYNRLGETFVKISINGSNWSL